MSLARRLTPTYNVFVLVNVLLNVDVLEDVLVLVLVPDPP